MSLQPMDPEPLEKAGETSLYYETRLPAGVQMSRGVVSNAGIPPTSLTLSRQRRVSVPVEGGGQISDAQLFICGD